MAELDILKPDYTRFISPWAPDPRHSIHNPQPGPIYCSPWGPCPEVCVGPILVSTYDVSWTISTAPLRSFILHLLSKIFTAAAMALAVQQLDLTNLHRPHNLNVHELCFPSSSPLPPDYDLFINAVTSTRLTLHQFYARTCALARALRHDGPNPLKLIPSPEDDTTTGEILGLLSPNHIHYSTLAHACFRAEVVFGLISPASTSYELWWMLRKMQITGLIVHESLLDTVRAAVGMGRGEGDKKLVLDMRKVVVLSDDPFLEAVQGFPTVEGMIRAGEKMSEPSRKLVGGNKLCYLFQSSGTSGLPKAMMVTHRNAVHSAMQTLIVATQVAIFNKTTPLSPQRVLAAVPAYHSYGMILWILRINLQQFTNVLLPRWDLELALQSIQTYRITHLPLVPPLVRQLAQSPLTEKYDLSSVVSCTSGAAYLPSDVAYELAKKLPQGVKMPVLTGLGMSEAASVCGAMAYPCFGLEPSVPGTLGYLLPGMQCRFVNPETLKDVPKGEIGELWVRGPVVIPGYFQEPAANRETFTEPGWLRSGDMIKLDKYGRFVYVERLKEMIKVKGLQVAATEVEDLLLEHPEKLVRDACVSGVDNGRGDGSVFVRAWVVLSDAGKNVTPEQLEHKLKRHIEQRLSKHKWLTGGVEAVDSIPRTNSGKMLRRQMRDKYNQKVKQQEIAKTKL